MIVGSRFLVVLGLAILTQTPQPFEGRVVSESGNPLAGVSVIKASAGRPDIEVGILVNSDETGTFRLNERPDVLFLQKEGYLPFLYRVDGIDQSPLITMKPIDADSVVSFPGCGAPGPGKRLIRVGIGRSMLLGEKTVFKQTNGVDTWSTEIFYKGKPSQHMRISSGMIAFLGYPKVDALARSLSISTRFIDTRSGRDVRGATTDGKHWRWGFFTGGEFEYYDASPAAAAFFDRQIDGFCIPQTASAK